jgi:hypothetical protein
MTGAEKFSPSDRMIARGREATDALPGTGHSDHHIFADFLESK